MGNELAGRCPVCQARFRGTINCSRCGGNLRPLMVLAATAWRLRQEARKAIFAGDYLNAQRLAQQAQSLQASPLGRRLHLLSGWLIEHFSESPAQKSKGREAANGAEIEERDKKEVINATNGPQAVA
jgi:predicted amidophosphoribosyltransferase